MSRPEPKQQIDLTVSQPAGSGQPSDQPAGCNEELRAFAEHVLDCWRTRKWWELATAAAWAAGYRSINDLCRVTGLTAYQVKSSLQNIALRVSPAPAPAPARGNSLDLKLGLADSKAVITDPYKDESGEANVTNPLLHEADRSIHPGRNEPDELNRRKEPISGSNPKPRYVSRAPGPPLVPSGWTQEDTDELIDRAIAREKERKRKEAEGEGGS